MVATITLLPRTRRWTRLEYEHLVELGVFQPGERLELVDGLLLVREPQGRRHAATIRRLLAALRRALGDDWQIDSQLPIALDDASQPEPDVAVLPRDPSAYRDAHPTQAALIARASVPEYWIVDLAREALEVHRVPEASPTAVYGWRYRTIEVLRTPATVTPLIAADTPIPVADLLR